MESTSGTSRSATADLTSSRFQKTVCLYDWWLTKAAEGFEGSRLAVGGVTSQGYPNKSKHSCTRQVQRVFTSSPIIKRHDAFSLETSDGICVVIKGLINKDQTMGNGFSSEIFNHFVFGFPPQWKECGLKYMGDQSANGFASPQEGLEKSVPSSLNKESPVNHSKVVSEERHESQILEECSHDVPEVTSYDELEKSIGYVMNLDGDRRRNSKRLSQPSTEGSYPTCDIEPGLNCGDVMNQDEDCERNSNTLSKPPIEPGIAISSPQQRNAQRSSYNKSGRKKQSNHSKVVREERHESQILEECSQDVPEVTFDAEQEQSIGDVMNLDGDRRRKSKRLSQPSTEGSYPTCDIEPGLNCGDVMNQDENCERNSNTLSNPPIEPGIAISSPQQRNAQRSSYYKTGRKKQSNRSKVVHAERHESQILERCSKDILEVTFDAEQEQSIGDVMNLDGDCRRKSIRLSQPSTEGSYPTCDIEPGLNCGDVMNQDEDCERNSNTLSKSPIEPGIEISSPQQRNAHRSSYNKTGRQKQSNRSKVVHAERHESQILERCSKDILEVTFDAEQEQSIGDVMNLDGDCRRKSIRLSQPSTEGSYPTCDIEPGLNCGDVMNQDEDCERNSNTLSKSPIEPGIEISSPQQRNAHRSSYNKTRRKKQRNRFKVLREEGAKTQVLKECSKHVPKAAIDVGVAEEGQNGTCLVRKGSTKQATPNSKIKRKISFESPGKCATEEAKESKTKISPDGSSFKRSRSGRLLIPQMEYWRNQVPVYDRDRSITGILEDSMVTPLRGSRSEPPRKRR